MDLKDFITSTTRDFDELRVFLRQHRTRLDAAIVSAFDRLTKEEKSVLVGVLPWHSGQVAALLASWYALSAYPRRHTENFLLDQLDQLKPVWEELDRFRDVLKPLGKSSELEIGAMLLKAMRTLGLRLLAPILRSQQLSLTMSRVLDRIGV